MLTTNVSFTRHLSEGDGLIQHRELQHVMRACMEENGMQFSEEQVSQKRGEKDIATFDMMH